MNSIDSSRIVELARLLGTSRIDSASANSFPEKPVIHFKPVRGEPVGIGELR